LPTLLSTVGTIILNLDTGAIAKTSGPYTKLDSVVVSTFDIGQGAFYSSKIKCDKIRKNGGFIFTPDTAAPGTSIHIRVNGWFTATGNTAAFAGTTASLTQATADSAYCTLPSVATGPCAVTLKNGNDDSILISSPAYSVIPQYALTITATNGTVTKTPSAAQYDSGTVVGLKAHPATGYHFVSWSGDASGTSDSATVTMTGAKSVGANFAATATPGRRRHGGFGLWLGL
jgi:hypothetical protein